MNNISKELFCIFISVGTHLLEGSFEIRPISLITYHDLSMLRRVSEKISDDLRWSDDGEY